MPRRKYVDQESREVAGFLRNVIGLSEEDIVFRYPKIYTKEFLRKFMKRKDEEFEERKKNARQILALMISGQPFIQNAPYVARRLGLDEEDVNFLERFGLIISDFERVKMKNSLRESLDLKPEKPVKECYYINEYIYDLRSEWNSRDWLHLHDLVFADEMIDWFRGELPSRIISGFIRPIVKEILIEVIGKKFEKEKFGSLQELMDFVRRDILTVFNNLSSYFQPYVRIVSGEVVEHFVKKSKQESFRKEFDKLLIDAFEKELKKSPKDSLKDFKQLEKNE